MLSKKPLEPSSPHKSSESEEDELEKIFDKVLTQKSTLKQHQNSLELIETKESKELNHFEEAKAIFPEDKKPKLSKAKSFYMKPEVSVFITIKKESSKEN